LVKPDGTYFRIKTVDDGMKHNALVKTFILNLYDLLNDIAYCIQYYILYIVVPNKWFSVVRVVAFLGYTLFRRFTLDITKSNMATVN